LAHLSCLTNLTSIELCGCSQLIMSLNFILSGFTNLRKINLSNSYTQNITLPEFIDIHIINFSGCNTLSDKNLNYLAGYANLEELNLFKCQHITSEGLFFMAVSI